MKPSFVVYIDESGDEGFVFRDDGSGSSRWFVLSAAVIRRQNDLQMVSCLKEVRDVLGKAPKTPLDFVDLKHEQRVPYIRRVCNLPIRTMSVMVYKPLIQEPDKFHPEHQISALPLCHANAVGAGFLALPRAAPSG